MALAVALAELMNSRGSLHRILSDPVKVGINCFWSICTVGSPIHVLLFDDNPACLVREM